MISQAWSSDSVLKFIHNYSLDGCTALCFLYTFMKVAKSECVSAMLVHFQKLFDVRDTSGICTRMSDVYCKLSQYQNAIKTLQSILNISEFVCVTIVPMCHNRLWPM